MDSPEEYKHSFPEIDVNREAALRMLSKIASMKTEERDLAMDPFKRADEDTNEDSFWLQGKTAIMYLDSASKASNYLGDMAKDIMKIVFREDAPEGGSASLGDLDKKHMSEIADRVTREMRIKRGQPKLGPPSEEK